MTKLEMVKEAMTQLGDVSADALVAFVENKYGTKIEPKFMPLFKASIREQERLVSARQAAKEAADQAKAASKAEAPVA